MARLLNSFEFRFALLNKQKGLLEQVSHFFKGSFKLLDEATLGVFVLESEELRFQRWETSTMKQVQSEYAMVFANRHKVELDRLAAMLESRILFPDVCKRAIVSHAKVLLLAACYFFLSLCCAFISCESNLGVSLYMPHCVCLDCVCLLCLSDWKVLPRALDLTSEKFSCQRMRSLLICFHRCSMSGM